jgi:hypothetical protein
MFRRAKETWLSWHRGLPNPPGKPDFSVALLRRALKETNALYWRGLREFYGGLFARSKGAKSKEEEVERLREKEANKTADDLASAFNVSKTVGPDAIWKWASKRASMIAEVVGEFGAGFREGKNAPDTKLDWREWINHEDAKKKKQ